jgi:hypothetical protein
MGQVTRIAVIDYHQAKAFDENGKPIPYESDWQNITKSFPDREREVHFWIDQGASDDRDYRVRFGDNLGYSSGFGPPHPKGLTASVEVSADFPILNGQESVKIDVERTDNSWEEVFSGRYGENTDIAEWDVNQKNGPLLYVKNVCPTGEQSKYQFRARTEPMLDSLKNQGIDVGADGRAVLFGYGDANKFKSIRILRRKYSSVYSGWLAFGAKGNSNGRRVPPIQPVFIGAFGGIVSDASNPNYVQYQKNRTGWDASGKPLQVGPKNSFCLVGDSKGMQPVWVAFRLPEMEKNSSLRLTDASGSNITLSTELSDPGDGGGKIGQFAVRGMYVQPKKTLRLLLASGPYTADFEVTKSEAESRTAPQSTDAFSIYRHQGVQTDVNVKLRPNLPFADRRLRAVNTKGEDISGFGTLSGNGRLGTMLLPKNRDEQVAKVVVESRPYREFVFKDVPLQEPKP